MKDNGETIIEVNDLVRRFGDRQVLDDISFNVHRGETLVIMGGSGCGKSTLLRHMIGSMKPTSGFVKIFGEEITGMKEREIERVRLRFGMLFQSGALSSYVVPSEEGPHRKYYSLTPTGLELVAGATGSWRQFADVLDALLTRNGNGKESA